MKNFISWIIANLNTLTNIIYIAIAVAISVMYGGDDKALDAVLFSFTGIFIVSFLSILTRGEKLNASTILVLLAAAFEFYLIFSSFGASYPKTALVISFIVAGILSIFIAAFVSRNFEDVVSRRMLWRNSNVDMFSMKISYVINRYFNATIRIASLLFILLFLPWGLCNPHQIEKANQAHVQDTTAVQSAK